MAKEIQEVLSTLIEDALSGDSLTFEFITSVPEFIQFRYRSWSLKSIIRILSSCSKRMFKSYCKAIESGDEQPTKLLACATIERAVDFYKRDLLTIDQMLGEYEAYLMTGNQLDFILFRQRKEHKLWDHRRF